VREATVRALLAAACLSAFAAAPAGAATVSSAAGAVHLVALPGERNLMQVSPAPDGGVDVFDSVPIRPGTGCVATSTRSAHCPGFTLGLDIDLGDGNDELAVEGAVGIPLVITGGAGDDLILASPGADVIDGGLGDDVLSGRGGADGIVGGAGDDVIDGGDGADTLEGGDDVDLLDGAGGPDTLRGGPGADTVTYWSRTASVRVALDGRAEDGEAGEADDVADDVEAVLGGSGDDVLATGDAGATLAGGAGADSLSGGAGGDVLRGEAGEDRIDGGAGDDLLDGGDGADALVAGDGDDVLEGGEAGDGLAGEAGADILRGGDGADVLFGDGRDPGAPPAAPTGPAPATDEGPASDADDVLDGGAGPDRLEGGSGLDEHSAGAGDDTVDAREPDGTAPDAPGELVACGEGADASGLDAADTSTDCEAVTQTGAGGVPAGEVLGVQASAPPVAAPARGSGTQPPLGVPVLRGGVVSVPVRCSGTEGAPCAVSLTVRALPARSSGRRRHRSAGTLVARLNATIPTGRTIVLSAPLSRGGAALVRRRRSARSVTTALLRPQGGAPRRWSRPLQLTRRGLARP